MDLPIVGDSASLILIVLSLCGVLVLARLMRRSPGQITQSELRKRMKHLQ